MDWWDPFRATCIDIQMVNALCFTDTLWFVYVPKILYHEFHSWRSHDEVLEPFLERKVVMMQDRKGWEFECIRRKHNSLAAKLGEDLTSSEIRLPAVKISQMP